MPVADRRRGAGLDEGRRTGGARPTHSSRLSWGRPIAARAVAAQPATAAAEVAPSIRSRNRLRRHLLPMCRQY